jgi:hypothetical protein
LRSYGARADNKKSFLAEAFFIVISGNAKSQNCGANAKKQIAFKAGRQIKRTVKKKAGKKFLNATSATNALRHA